MNSYVWAFIRLLARRSQSEGYIGTASSLVIYCYVSKPRYLCEHPKKEQTRLSLPTQCGDTWYWSTPIFPLRRYPISYAIGFPKWSWTLVAVFCTPGANSLHPISHPQAGPLTNELPRAYALPAQDRGQNCQAMGCGPSIGAVIIKSIHAGSDK